MTTDAERSLIGRIGAHERWAQCTDRKAAMAPLHQGFEARFIRLADPDGTAQAEIERAGGADSPTGRDLIRKLQQRTESLRTAYFLRLSLAGAKAKKAKATAKSKN